MHALPIKPRLAIVRTEPEKHAADHPHHLSPKRAISPAHQHQGSPPKTPPLEVHRIEPEGEEADALESHPLPNADLQRFYSIKQSHPVKDVLAEDSGG